MVDTSEEVARQSKLSTNKDLTNKDSVLAMLQSELFKQDKMSLPGVRAGKEVSKGVPLPPKGHPPGPGGPGRVRGGPSRISG